MAGADVAGSPFSDEWPSSVWCRSLGLSATCRKSWDRAGLLRVRAHILWTAELIGFIQSRIQRARQDLSDRTEVRRTTSASLLGRSGALEARALRSCRTPWS